MTTEETARRWSLKRLAALGFGLGSGATLAILAVIAGFSWYQGRPKPPAPWNSAAIVATLSTVDTEGEDNTVLFRYLLENKTEYDYQLAEGNQISLMARLERQKGLSRTLSEYLSLDLPIFIPPGQRQVVDVHLRYAVPIKRPSSTTRQQAAEYEKLVRKHLAEDPFANLDGFVLFDHSRRYQINLPKGW